jgi:hypothetical protein
MLKNVISFFVGLGLALGLCTTVASATPMAYVAVSPDKTISVTIENRACTDEKVAALVSPEVLVKLKAAKVTIHGVDVQACYMVIDEFVAIVMEDGSQGVLPVEIFVPAEKV